MRNPASLFHITLGASSLKQ